MRRSRKVGAGARESTSGECAKTDRQVAAWYAEAVGLDVMQQRESDSDRATDSGNWN